MQRRLDPETSGRIQTFFKGGAPIFVTFKRSFSRDLVSSNLSTKNNSRGSGGMLPRKNFENLHTAMAILVLFEQFLRKVCHIFGP